MQWLLAAPASSAAQRFVYRRRQRRSTSEMRQFKTNSHRSIRMQNRLLCCLNFWEQTRRKKKKKEFPFIKRREKVRKEDFIFFK